MDESIMRQNPNRSNFKWFSFDRFLDNQITILWRKKSIKINIIFFGQK